MFTYLYFTTVKTVLNSFVFVDMKHELGVGGHEINSGHQQPVSLMLHCAHMSDTSF